MGKEYWQSSPFGEDSLFHPKANEMELKITYGGCHKDDLYTYLFFDIKRKKFKEF